MAKTILHLCLQRLLILVLLLISSFDIVAQTPQGINYQAVARNADGEPLADTTLDIRINIASDINLSNIDYAEVHALTTNRFGLFTLIIGEGAPLNGIFSGISWETGEKYLNVEIGDLDMGTTKLMSVPYALYAASAGNTALLDSVKFNVLNNQLSIFSNGDSVLADLSALAEQTSLDTILLENDSALVIIEAGDTFSLDLSVFQNVENLDNDSTNELISGVSFNNDSLFINEGQNTLSVDLSSIYEKDSLQSFELLGDTNLVLVDGNGSTYEANLSGLARDSELADLENTLLLEMDADSTVLHDSINQVAADLTQHIAVDFDLDTLNERITSAFQSGDSLYIIEGGDTTAVDLSTLSPDTLDRIVKDDSNMVIVNQGSVFVNFNDEDQLTLTPSKFIFQNQNDIFIGNFLTGQSDDNTQYNENIGIGAQSLQETNLPTGNVGVGARTLQSLEVGDNNTAIGRWSGVDFNDGSDNVMLGNFAGGAVLNGDRNTFVGSNSGAGLGVVSDINGAVKIGFGAGSLDSADNRLFIDNSNTNAPLIWGDFQNDILQANGLFRTSIGQDTLTYPISDGNPNDVMVTNGDGSLSFVDPSTLISSDTLPLIRSNDSSNYITTELPDRILMAIDDTVRFEFFPNRLQINNPLGNTFIGAGGGVNSTTGTENVTVGTNAGLSLSTGTANVLIGNEAAKDNNGNGNIIIGRQAYEVGTNGNFNVIIGDHAGETNTGSGNIFIGRGAGNDESPSASGILAIAGGASGNTLIRGDLSNDSLQINGVLQTQVPFGDQLTYPIADGDSSWVMTTDGLGQLSFVDPSLLSVGDNLGNHALDSNLKLGNFYLSGDGDDEGITIDTSGRVVIGTPNINGQGRLAVVVNTTETLEPNGNGTLSLYNSNTGDANVLVRTSTTGGDPYISLDREGDQGWSLGMDVSDNHKFKVASFWGNIAADTRLSIDVLGNVGIGTTNPDSLLDVQGGARVQSLNINSAYTLPTADGAAGSLMQTDGSGTIGFVDPSSLFSQDTLPLIRSNDSSTFVSTSAPGVVTMALDDTIRYRFLDGRIDFENPSVYIGKGAGDNDGFAYADSVANVGIGYQALGNNAGIFGNTAVGTNALSNTTFNGPNNTAVGINAMRSNFNGANNVAVGLNALRNNGNGSGNVILGAGAGRAMTTGGDNTAVGVNAGQNLTVGSRNVFLGRFAGEAGAYSDRLYIDNSPTSTPLIYGDFFQDSLAVNGKLNINGNYTFPNTAPTMTGQVLTYDGNNLIWGFGNMPPSPTLSLIGDTLSINPAGNSVVLNDNNPLNETISNFSLSGSILSVEDGGSPFSVDLSLLPGNNNDTVGIEHILDKGSNANLDSLLNLSYLTIGTLTPAARLDIVDNSENFSLNISNTTNSSIDKKGIFTTVTGGGGGDNYAIYGQASAATGNKFGVYGSALGAGGIKYGLYGNAQGAGTNYAGYFDNGNVFIQNRLGIGQAVPSRRLDVLGDIGADSVFIGEINIAGKDFPDPNLADTGQVLTYDGLNMVWADPAAAQGGDVWDTLAGVTYTLTNQVGIGTASPAAAVGIESDQPFGLDVTMTGVNSGNNFGVSVIHSQTSTQTNTGFYSEMSGVAGISKGFATVVRGGGANYGLDADAVDPGGFENIGVRAISDSALTNYALAGYAGSQLGGVGYGVFGKSEGPGINWAGYFDAGNVRINDTLYLPAGAQNGYVLTTNALGQATWQAPGAAANIDTSRIADLDNNTFIAVDSANTGLADRITMSTNGSQIVTIEEDKFDVTFFGTDSLMVASTERLRLFNFGSPTINIENNRVAISDFANYVPQFLLDMRSSGNDTSLSIITSVGENSKAVGERIIATAGGFPNSYAGGTDLNITSADTAIAVKAVADAMSKSIAIYGSATGTGDTVLAGYFEKGNVLINDTLILPEGAQNGYVLTSDAGGKATWQAAPTGVDADWTTSGNRTYNVSDTIILGDSVGFGKFNVLADERIGVVVGLRGNSGSLNSIGMLIANSDNGTDENSAIIAYSSSNTASENYGIRSSADSSVFNVGVVATGGSPNTSSNESYGLLAQGASQNGVAFGASISGLNSNGNAYGSRNTATSNTDTAFAIYANSSTISGVTYSGYFNNGDVFIKDTLEVDSILKYNHSSVQQGYYLRTNADGTVYADTFATCPAGFVQVNNQFCIEQSARTTGEDWFDAADICAGIDAKLPSWFEWYTGTKEISVDYNTSQAWEWIDQASQNNASIAGGGIGATLEDRRKTIAADNPDSPTNTVQYRCVYPIK